jgi:hypothetical protein
MQPRSRMHPKPTLFCQTFARLARRVLSKRPAPLGPPQVSLNGWRPPPAGAASRPLHSASSRVDSLRQRAETHFAHSVHSRCFFKFGTVCWIHTLHLLPVADTNTDGAPPHQLQDVHAPPTQGGHISSQPSASTGPGYRRRPPAAQPAQLAAAPPALRPPHCRRPLRLLASPGAAAAAGSAARCSPPPPPRATAPACVCNCRVALFFTTVDLSAGCRPSLPVRMAPPSAHLSRCLQPSRWAASSIPSSSCCAASRCPATAACGRPAAGAGAHSPPEELELPAPPAAWAGTHRPPRNRCLRAAS